MCRLPHKRRKGLCLTPKQQFRLMMQGPFLLCLCQRGAFTGSQTISFSLFLWAVSGKPCLTARSINGTSRHARQANREEWFYPSDRTRSDRHIKSYFLAGGLPGSTLPAMSLFLFGVFPFSRISLLKFSCLICLHFRLPPFSHLSGSASGCHFRSGRKGNSGIGRECKVKPPVFGKNLQPYG